MPLRILRIQSGIFFFPVLQGVSSDRAVATAIAFSETHYQIEPMHLPYGLLSTAFDGLGDARVPEKSSNAGAGDSSLVGYPAPTTRHSKAAAHRSPLQNVPQDPRLKMPLLPEISFGKCYIARQRMFPLRNRSPERSRQPRATPSPSSSASPSCLPCGSLRRSNAGLPSGVAAWWRSIGRRASAEPGLSQAPWR